MIYDLHVVPVDQPSDYKTINRVPVPMRIQPSREFKLNFSCRKTNANTSMMTTLSLSMGTTFDASPICSTLKYKLIVPWRDRAG